MSELGMILLMGGALYLLRLSGLALPVVALPRRWDEGLAHLPIALLAALSAVSIAGGDAPGSSLVAATGAILIGCLTGRLWATIAGGLALAWLARIIWS